MRRIQYLLLLSAMALGAACSHKKVVTAPTPLVATPAMVDSLWSEALTYYARKKWEKAVVLFERVALEMPFDDPRLHVKFMYVGEARLAEGNNLQAVREFRRLSDEYPSDSLAPRALLRAGDAYKALWRRVELDPTYGETALTTYQELLNRYPGSPAAKEGAARIAQLNNWFALKEYKTGEYYYKFHAYDSAILVLRHLVATWPQAAIVPEALGKLVATYKRLGYVDDVRDMCSYFRANWPKAPKLASTCPVNPPAAPAAPGATGH